MDTLEEKVRWTREIAKTHDPLLFYEEHYTGITRGILQKENKSLYNRLERDGLLHRIPTIPKADFGEDPVAYYQEHYNGVTRGELQKQNRSLYNRLRKEDVLKDVPLAIHDFGKNAFGKKPFQHGSIRTFCFQL